jgi:uncharacterized protein (DUF1697 family)
MPGAATVILLRGINVGGRAKLAMGTLRALAEQLGYEDASTYVQSGNLVARVKAAKRVPTELRDAIRAETGLDVGVVVRSAAEWRRVVENNPFPDLSGTQLHVTFLDAPPAPTLKQFDASPFAPADVRAGRRELYLALPDGIGRSKLAAKVIKLAGASAVATTRNWNTVLQLDRMVHEL